MEKFDEDQGTAYLISRIRCNNILIWILLHLILEIRYAKGSGVSPTVAAGAAKESSLSGIKPYSNILFEPL